MPKHSTDRMLSDLAKITQLDKWKSWDQNPLPFTPGNGSRTMQTRCRISTHPELEGKKTLKMPPGRGATVLKPARLTVGLADSVLGAVLYIVGRVAASRTSTHSWQHPLPQVVPTWPNVPEGPGQPRLRSCGFGEQGRLQGAVNLQTPG